MSTLESLWNKESSSGASNPTAKYDYKTQVLRVRLGADLPKMKGPLIRHWVDGVGWTECGQKPYKKRDGSFGLWGECVFCEERKALREQLKAAAIANGQTDISKEEAKKVSALHKRTIEMFAPALVEVREKNKVVKELEAKAVAFNVIDLFFSQQNRHYKILSQIFENKGTLLDHWFIISGNGQIMIDDKLTKEEKAQPIEVDLSYFDEKTKSYEDGSSRYLNKAEVKSKAEPIDDEDFDDEIPF